MTEVVIPQLGDPSPPIGVTSVQEQPPDPALAPVVMGWFQPTARTRNWCLQIAGSQWLDYVTKLFVFLNCVSLGASRPGLEKSYTFKIVDTLVVAFFLIEMHIKILAMGLCGCPGSYARNKWNMFDMFINVAELLSYLMQHLGFDMTLFQVLGSMRVFSRVESMRDLMTRFVHNLHIYLITFLLDMFVTGIFTVMGVQLSCVSVLSWVVWCSCTFVVQCYSNNRYIQKKE